MEIVIRIQDLAKYMIGRYLDPWGKLRALDMFAFRQVACSVCSARLGFDSLYLHLLFNINIPCIETAQQAAKQLAMQLEENARMDLSLLAVFRKPALSCGC